jgi:hypothetical protein
MSEIPASGRFDAEGLLDPRAEVARIDRERAKFVAEQRKLMAEAEKLSAEQQKLYSEAFKLDRDWRLAPWVIVSAMTAGAALFAAGAAFMRLFN